MGSKTPVLSFANSSERPAGKKKVALKPRHSLMDWIRFTQSGKDLTSTGGKHLEVSMKELSKHNSRTDAWISIKGKVYNITHYMEYHPGGEEELLRGAGQDATDLFNEVHQWVNVDSMLQKCFIGFLKKKSWGLEGLTTKIEPKKLKSPIAMDRLCISPGPPPGSCDVPPQSGKPRWPVSPSAGAESGIALRSAENDSAITLIFESDDMITCQAFVIDLVDKTLFAKVDTLQNSQLFSIDLQKDVEEDYRVSVRGAEVLEINLRKVGSLSLPVAWTICSQPTESLYWPCLLIGKRSVTPDTRLFTLLLPAGTRMCVPVGGHVHVKLDIGGMEVARSYTPLVPMPAGPRPETEEEEGRRICLLVKVYEAGALTPALDRLPSGACLSISDYSSTISEELLSSSGSVSMFAAGTGITPMINIIHWVIGAKDRKRPLHLFFFNKTEEDILWRKELDQCCQTYNEFRVVHVLSEAGGEWLGLRGRIDGELARRLLPEGPDRRRQQQIFVCGPPSFNEVALRSIEAIGFSMDHVYAFSG